MTEYDEYTENLECFRTKNIKYIITKNYKKF